MASKQKKTAARRGRPRVTRVAWSSSRVYALMERADMTIEDIADAAGVASSTAYKWQSPGLRSYAPTDAQAAAVIAAMSEAMGKRVRLSDVAPKKRAPKKREAK